MRRIAGSRLRATLATSVATIAIASLAACGPGDDTQTCSGMVVGTLVVSEVQADYDAPTGSSGADTGHEWFEIYNSSSSPVELQGLLVEHMRPSEAVGKGHTMRTLSIPANGYVVLGNVVPEAAPAYVDYGYGSDLGDLFNADGGKIRLTCGTTLVDEAIYDSVSAGHTRVLDGKTAPDYQANDSQASWCDAPEIASVEYEPANFGTPGGPNQDCMNVIPGTCDDGGTMRATVPPVPGDLVISEVMPDPSAVADTAGEWIEVLVTRDVDINDLGIATATGNPVILSSPSCIHAAVGTHLVFARNSDMTMNGGLPRVDGSTVALANSGGAVRLLMGATELDAMTWPSARAGKSIQLDDSFMAPGDNDVAANLCDGNMVYGAGDSGTPGAANRDCGGSTAGMCMDVALGAMRPIVKPTAGQLTINEWMPDPSLVADTAGEWFEIKATADVDLNGLQAGTATLGATPIVPVAGPCLRISTAGFALFARNGTAATNGMLPPIDGLESLSLTNAAGTLQIGIDGTQLHMVTWAASSPGKSIMLDTDGTQCNAPVGVPLYNGTDTGTPRAINTPPECP